MNKKCRKYFSEDMYIQSIIFRKNAKEVNILQLDTNSYVRWIGWVICCQLVSRKTRYHVSIKFVAYEHYPPKLTDMAKWTTALFILQHKSFYHDFARDSILTERKCNVKLKSREDKYSIRQ